MLLEIINKRYSARFWEDLEIEKEKIDYILDCAYQAPSKQCTYPYQILVLGSSKQAKKIKKWLFWHDTWCVNGERANPKDSKNIKDKRFNGQYRAPLLLMWAFTPVSDDHKDGNHYSHLPEELCSVQERDMAVSASFAMLAAEEQGLRTCFGACHTEDLYIKNVSPNPIIVPLVLGIGYAKEKDYSVNKMTDPVYNERGSIKGYQSRNLSQNFPVQYHSYRKRKKTKDELIKFI